MARRVDGIPAVYETWVRPDAVHTSLVIGVAWMDTKLLRATLYSGSTIPGGGPYRHSAPISRTAAKSLVAAFNAGFLMNNADGGYYTDGKTITRLRTGAASFVIYRNGSVNIGDWGRGLSLTPDVVSVRQNLDLLVRNGKPVPGLNPNDTTQWGFTLGNAVYVWRSGVGITANGALVYVGGPGLNITTLADILARAGAVRAMELDINTDWVNFASYNPHGANAPATPANGKDLLPEHVRRAEPLLRVLVVARLLHHVRQPDAAATSRGGSEADPRLRRSRARAGSLRRAMCGADLVHVEFARLADQLLQRRLGQRAGLGVQDDAVADHHQRRDRRDSERAREFRLGFGVDLGEHRVRVLARHALEDRAEHAAGTAPGRPEVDQHQPVAPGHRVEVLRRQLDRRHRRASSAHRASP